MYLMCTAFCDRARPGYINPRRMRYSSSMWPSLKHETSHAGRADVVVAPNNLIMAFPCAVHSHPGVCGLGTRKVCLLYSRGAARCRHINNNNHHHHNMDTSRAIAIRVLVECLVNTGTMWARCAFATSSAHWFFDFQNAISERVCLMVLLFSAVLGSASCTMHGNKSACEVSY